MIDNFITLLADALEKDSFDVNMDEQIQELRRMGFFNGFCCLKYDL